MQESTKSMRNNTIIFILYVQVFDRSMRDGIFLVDMRANVGDDLKELSRGERVVELVDIKRFVEWRFCESLDDEF